MKKYKKFTLIELIVTITVISILATMLMSVLTIADERVKTMTCKDNMKGIAVAQGGYISDHNGWFTTNYPDDDRYGDLKKMQWDGLLGYGNYDGRALIMEDATTAVYFSNYPVGQEREDVYDLHSMYICPSDETEKNRMTRSYTLNETEKTPGNDKRGIAVTSTTVKSTGRIHWASTTSLRAPAQNIIAFEFFHEQNVLAFSTQVVGDAKDLRKSLWNQQDDTDNIYHGNYNGNDDVVFAEFNAIMGDFSVRTMTFDEPFKDLNRNHTSNSINVTGTMFDCIK